jgi:hypothetical protein
MGALLNGILASLEGLDSKGGHCLLCRRATTVIAAWTLSAKPTDSNWVQREDNPCVKIQKLGQGKSFERVCGKAKRSIK